MAVPEYDEVDGRSSRGSRRFRRRLAMVPMQQQKCSTAGLDPDAIWQDFDQVKWIGIPTHGNHRSHGLQRLQHRDMSRIPRMEDQIDPGSIKKFTHEFK